VQPAARPGAGRHIFAGITWAEARRVLSLFSSALRGIHTGICVGGVPLDRQVPVSHLVPESLDATGNHRARLLRPHGVNSRSIQSRSDWQGQRSVRYPTTGLTAVGPRATYGPDVRCSADTHGQPGFVGVSRPAHTYPHVSSGAADRFGQLCNPVPPAAATPGGRPNQISASGSASSRTAICGAFPAS
jgi:hypothetical protein